MQTYPQGCIKILFKSTLLQEVQGREKYGAFPVKACVFESAILWRKRHPRATADATENPKSGPGDTSRPKVSPEVQLVWARVISRAASDSDFAAVLRDNLAEAFAVFGVSGLGDIDPEQDLIPSYSAALEMIGAAAHPPAAASGLMPGQAKPNPVGDDITTASSGCACAAE